jgi:acyl-CoA thioester hydrolase
MAQTVSCSVQLKVPFYDIDLMQVVWNGNYQKYFEVARQALFKKYGLDFYRYMQEKRYAFPVIRSKVKHIRPLRLDDEFICKATLREASVKIVIDFEIRLIADDQICTVGRSEQAALLMPEMEMAYKIPEEIQNALCGEKARK